MPWLLYPASRPKFGTWPVGPGALGPLGPGPIAAVTSEHQLIVATSGWPTVAPKVH